ncbi:zinc transporter 1 isoform X2 [Silurus meridionalis]|uniref:zinc transporter 1 isoform X2 n=1 Tax=Silurus meridionalis TaxID=175797 RepID=UPI001EECBA13|nr:zinc transporter 1 isoform X2 [Silurus meridionalis]
MCVYTCGRCVMDRSAVWAEPLHRCMLVLTCVLVLCEVIVGRLCESLINTVDSFHTLYVLIGMAISTRGAEEIPSVSAEPRATEPQENHTSPTADGSQYSRFRVKLVGGLISALLLSSLCVSISFDILSHTLQPHPLQRPLLATALGAVSLLFNILLLVWRCSRRTDSGVYGLKKSETETSLPPAGSPHGDVLMFCNPGLNNDLHPDPQDHSVHRRSNSISHDSSHTDAHGEEDKCEGSSRDSGHAARQCDVSGCIRNIITMFHSLLGSSLVLLNGSLHLLCVRFQWRCDLSVYLDPGFSMLTVLVLLAAVVPELCRHVLLLLQASPPGLCIEELRAEMKRVPGVLGVHELHVWQLSEMCVVASVHVHWPSCLNALECSELLRSITDVLRRFGVKFWTIQPEFVTSHPEDAAFRPDCTLRCGKVCVRKMCCLPPETPFSSTSVHKKQNTHTNN